MEVRMLLRLVAVGILFKGYRWLTSDTKENTDVVDQTTEGDVSTCELQDNGVNLALKAEQEQNALVLSLCQRQKRPAKGVNYKTLKDKAHQHPQLRDLCESDALKTLVNQLVSDGYLIRKGVKVHRFVLTERGKAAIKSGTTEVRFTLEPTLDQCH